MYLKIKEDVNCDMETALAWAVSAKNALINNNGFSPYQIAYGKNPNLPSNVNNKLSAFEDHNTTEQLVKHINALHSGRKAFIQSESSEKIKRAFRNNVRPSGKQYSINEEVYYKREDSQKWKGPAKVLGQDGPVISLRHGTCYIKAHVCRVQPINKNKNESNIEIQQSRIADNPNISNNSEPVTLNYSNSEDEIENEEPLNQSENIITENQESPEKNKQQILPNNVISSADPSKVQLPELKFKPGQEITFCDKAGLLCTAKILSRAGKATGIYKHYYNLEYLYPENLKGTQTNINLQDVGNLQIINHPDISPSPVTPNVNFVMTEEVYFTEDISYETAKQNELKSWKNNDVYSAIKNDNQKTVSLGWMCSLKETPKGIIPKACLVLGVSKKTTLKT